MNIFTLLYGGEEMKDNLLEFFFAGEFVLSRFSIILILISKTNKSIKLVE